MKKIVNGVAIDATEADLEQTAIDAAAWTASAALRAAQAAERRLGRERDQREIAISVLPVGHPKRVAAEEVEALWQAAGVRS